MRKTRSTRRLEARVAELERMVNDLIMLKASRVELQDAMYNKYTPMDWPMVKGKAS